MKILGIHDGHNASVCLMLDGKIEYLVQEERIVKEKNKSGFPYKSLELIMSKFNLKPEDIDKIGFNGDYMPKPFDRLERINVYKKFLTDNQLISTSKIKNVLKTIGPIAKPFEEKNRKHRLGLLKELGFDIDKVEFINHHLLHAATSYFGNGNYEDKVLILTNDGAGDRICSSVNIGYKGNIEKIAETHEYHSIAGVYAIFTFLTGMVPLEHEFKIMGMAPYADPKGCRKVADEFWDMFEFSDDGLSWKFTKGGSVFRSMQMFKDFMFLKRFDHLMGGLQLFIEEFLVKWVKNTIQKTGIKKLALGGGTFMNVKANKLLMEIEEVEEIFIFPSCGDEANAAGICYFLENKFEGLQNINQLEDVYFGVEYTDKEIEQSFEKYNFTKYKYKITKQDNIEKKLAELLAEGYVLARFKGREEFGARSLGNRAIIADPSKPEVIKEINEMIKNRDFWMPFASSILDEDIDKYIAWNGTKEKNNPYYMIMTYDTNPIAHTEISGGIHPYDKTVRPQLVTKEHNIDYWNLIKEFKNITGIGGILNTSLNLHGLPLVYDPEDAFHVMENSSLKYLALENYLIEKI
jgi:carbamoyltransferase